MNPNLSGNLAPGGFSHETAFATFTIPVSPLVVVTSSLPDATFGSAYTATVTATGGIVAYTWDSALAAQTLPVGLALNASTGVISGTPSGLGGQRVWFSVRDSTGVTSSVQLVINVNFTGTGLSITTASLPPGIAGSPYSATVTAGGGLPPYIWAILGSAPPGIGINSSTGVISGTPAAFGIFSLTIGVVDQTGILSDVKLYTITLKPVLVVTTTSLPVAAVGIPYSFTLQASGGTLPYYWYLTAGVLHPGLTLDAVSGVISGTPTSLVSSSLTFEVIDSA